MTYEENATLRGQFTEIQRMRDEAKAEVERLTKKIGWSGPQGSFGLAGENDELRAQLASIKQIVDEADPKFFEENALGNNWYERLVEASRKGAAPEEKAYCSICGEHMTWARGGFVCVNCPAPKRCPNCSSDNVDCYDINTLNSGCWKCLSCGLKWDDHGKVEQIDPNACANEANPEKCPFDKSGICPTPENANCWPEKPAAVLSFRQRGGTEFSVDKLEVVPQDEENEITHEESQIFNDGTIETLRIHKKRPGSNDKNGGTRP